MPRLPGALSRFVNAMMFRVLRSRRFQNANVLSLTTTGARTGEQRRTTLVYFPDGDNRILIVGSGGGTASHPAWFFNIARHPDRVWVNLGDRQFKVAPDLARRLGPAPR
jgi:deazaflavin-dependent oxidoreductase (nitroreductase family)